MPARRPPDAAGGSKPDKPRVRIPSIRWQAAALAAALFLGTAAPASAARVGDVTRLAGQRETRLTGMGLVVGLNGTGDGGDFLPAIRPLAQMLSAFNMGANAAELEDVDNVALVSVTATVPAAGARNGDKIDLFVTSIGAADSLAGGRLFVTPLGGPAKGGPVLALGGGNVVVEDPATPTVGRVRGGAVMERDLSNAYVFGGQFTLVLDDPSATVAMATAIARVINDSEGSYGGAGVGGVGGFGERTAVAAGPIAEAIDAKNVVVTVPAAERANANNLIARVERLPLPPVDSPARVTVNNRTGTIVLSGDVEIEPAVISHRGLTISTIEPEPAPTAARPRVLDREFVAIDPEDQGGPRLRDLLASLDQLKVPADERISIVKELHRSGKLRAELYEE